MKKEARKNITEFFALETKYLGVYIYIHVFIFAFVNTNRLSCWW